MLFFTSDTHFAHRNIIEYCKRPFANVDEMNQGLIDRWNSVVTPRDDVYHLGDFCMGGTEPADWLSKLNGRVHLIRGNHDPVVYDQGFESVHQYFELRWNKRKIILFHYPMISWNGSCRGSWHLFGHVHGALTTNRKLPYNGLTLMDSLAMDVGSDCHNWTPISVERVAQIMGEHEAELKARRGPGDGRVMDL